MSKTKRATKSGAKLSVKTGSKTAVKVSASSGVKTPVKKGSAQAKAPAAKAAKPAKARAGAKVPQVKTVKTSKSPTGAQAAKTAIVPEAPVKARKTASAGSAGSAASARLNLRSPSPKISSVRPPKKEMPKIPAILLEGDQPSVPSPSGPGDRYARGPEAGQRRRTSPVSTPEPAELPEAYGTQRLLLTARDPEWLYAHWDFTDDQLKRYNARSVDRHLVLRIYRNELAGDPHREIHVHPESRNWFAHVGKGGTRYVAEVGYYKTNDQWTRIATSGTTVTPSDSVSDDLSVWFETLPIDLRFEQILDLVKAATRDNVPLMEAIQQLRGSGFPGLPEPSQIRTGEWTAEQERALQQVVSMDSVRRVWMGSLEITELLRRQLLQELSSQAAAGGSWSGAVGSLSSPFGGMEGKKSFWFNVNAELIIYGATEPNASVTIGGRKIKLRPDGTFSYRFALPDGQYHLPAEATSVDGTDSRQAALQFNRDTKYQGEVKAHPQDPALKPPLAAHVA